MSDEDRLQAGVDLTEYKDANEVAPKLDLSGIDIGGVNLSSLTEEQLVETRNECDRLLLKISENRIVFGTKYENDLCPVHNLHRPCPKCIKYNMKAGV